MASNCPFCTPDPEALFLEEELVLGLWDRYPVSPGHISNRSRGGELDALERQLVTVVCRAEQRLDLHRQAEEAAIEAQLLDQLQAMEDLKIRHLRQMQLRLDRSDQPEAFKTRRRRDEQQGHIDRIFSDYDNWLRETHSLDDKPYIQVAAAFSGQER